jgi:hypothetical protein
MISIGTNIIRMSLVEVLLGEIKKDNELKDEEIEK